MAALVCLRALGVDLVDTSHQSLSASSLSSSVSQLSTDCDHTPLLANSSPSQLVDGSTVYQSQSYKRVKLSLPASDTPSANQMKDNNVSSAVTVVNQET